MPGLTQSTSPNNGAADKVYHTVTACVRCRQRKTRCDAGLPRCEPCERAKARCEYFDSSKNRLISRTYITSLQANVRRLQAELATAGQEDEHVEDPEHMVRGGGMTKFHENEEKKYLGPSSGIAMTRLVIELAKQNTPSRSIRDVVSSSVVKEAKDKFDEESSKPTSKVNTYMSDVAAPDIPSRDLMTHLCNLYVSKAQYMLPLLHEHNFRQDIEDVYDGSSDPSQNFQVRMVVAISLQRLDAYWAGLADSFYLAALNYLEGAARQRNLSSLQCYVLIAEYSLLTPTRTASYWVVGHAVRLCQDLGLCDEDTVKQSSSGEPFNPYEEDMRRRLFWIVLSLEYGLAHSLGRPSAFGTTVDHVNVNFFKTCDDRFITAQGIAEGAPQIMKKCIAIHFFRMRLLQAEIRRMLYLKKRDSPVDDNDPWFAEMEAKIDSWVARCPKNDEGSGLSQAWFEGRKNTILVFMYRPSPQIPEPSLRAAQRCYDASVFNLSLQKHQIAAQLVDITWIFAQAIFMALNSILWSLSYPEIRQQHPLEEVTGHVENALEAIGLCSERWPGVNSALCLYRSLAQACLRAYDTENSYVIQSPPKSSPSSHDIATPSSQYSEVSTGGMYLPPLATSQPSLSELTPTSSTMPPLTPSLSNTSGNSTSTPTSVHAFPMNMPLNLPPSAASNRSGPPSVHGHTPPPSYAAATPPSVTSIPAGYPMQIPPSNTSAPSAPSSAHSNTPPPIHTMITPTSVTSVPPGFPLPLPNLDSAIPSAAPSIPSYTPPPIESMPTFISYPPYQLSIQPPLQLSPVPQQPSSATISPIPQDHSPATPHGGPGSQIPVPPYPTVPIAPRPPPDSQNHSYHQTGPPSAPPHNAPAFSNTYIPNTHIYSPATDAHQAAFADPLATSSFFKDLPEFPITPNYDLDFGSVHKQTWRDPFHDVSFDMFTVPGEGRGSPHRNSSLSQEQQSEMMGELERRMSVREVPGLDINMLDPTFGSEETSYVDAVL